MFDAPPLVRPTVSVVMATYDGEEFIAEQLASILSQTLRPSEILVADDGSTDATLEIVRSTLGANVRILPPQGHLGVVRNFERAIGAATGDVVVLSDQDDRWRPDRIEALVAAVGGSGTGAAFSDAELFGARTGGLWDAIGFDARDRRRWRRDPMSVLLRHNVVTGATLAFRRSLVPLLLPLPLSGWHDLSIAVLVAAHTDVAAIAAPLVQYRLHESNAAGLDLRPLHQRRDGREEWRANLAEQTGHWVELRDRLAAAGRDEAAARAGRKVTTLATRAAMSDRRALRLPRIVSLLVTGRYHRYANGFKSVGRDAVRP